MPKFSVTYSVNNLYEVIVEATDKEDAISKVDGGHGGENQTLLAEEYLGINIVKDVTHEQKNVLSETKDPLKGNRSE